MIYVPILEELFFRISLIGILKEYDVPHYNFISSFLFGFSHFSNMNEHNKPIVLLQVISTTFLGYYISLFDNLLVAIFLHMFYNIISISVLNCIFLYYSNPNILGHRITKILKIIKYVIFL